MSWFRMDNDFFHHRKIIDLPKDAKLLHVAAIAHASGNLTDGKLTAGDLRVITALVQVNAKHAQTLIQAGLWDAIEGGYQIHDYLEYQQSADKVRAEREAAKNREPVKWVAFDGCKIISREWHEWDKRRRWERDQVERLMIAERDEWTCGICGGLIERDDLHIDHIFPLRLGGSSDPSNLQAAHALCNLKKGGRLTTPQQDKE